MVILSTSEKECVCYVETKNLDGETNLKVRRGIPELAHIKTPNDCAETRCFIDVEPPNEHLYSFNATLRLNPSNYDVPRMSVASPLTSSPTKASLMDRRFSIVNKDPEALYPVSINGVLMRGCIVRNTDWVIGVVAYTGSDTKLMRNAGTTPSKRSRIDRQLNPQVRLSLMIVSASSLF